MLSTEFAKTLLLVLCGFVASSRGKAETNGLFEAVGFALTGNDNANVRAVDRANCVFGIKRDTNAASPYAEISDEVFYLNNVQPDRIQIQSWVEKARFGDRPFVTIQLHGNAKVYDATRTPLRELSTDNQGTREVLDHIRQMDPQAFQTHHEISNEHELKLYTSEYDRIVRAWQYIYANGCTGKKSPF